MLDTIAVILGAINSLLASAVALRSLRRRERVDMPVAGSKGSVPSDTRRSL